MSLSICSLLTGSITILPICAIRHKDLAAVPTLDFLNGLLPSPSFRTATRRAILGITAFKPIAAESAFSTRYLNHGRSITNHHDYGKDMKKVSIVKWRFDSATQRPILPRLRRWRLGGELQPIGGIPAATAACALLHVNSSGQSPGGSSIITHFLFEEPL